MDKSLKKINRSLTELEIQQLKEKKRQIIINAVFASVGAIDLALLKILSDTLGTDDMTVTDLAFLFLGGSSSYLGSVLMGVNTIDYMDMKNDIYKSMTTKSKFKRRSRV